MEQKKSYTYELEIVNMVSGLKKEVREYDSSARLKIGNIYFHLPGLPVGGYRVLGEVDERSEKHE